MLTEGEGHIALRSGSTYTLLLYQYVHYDRDAIEHMLNRQVIVDPYTMFKSSERQIYTIEINGVEHSVWNAEFLSVGRRTGDNTYENWQRLGSPRVLNAWQRAYLEGQSLPAYRIAEIHADNGTFQLSCVVEPHDVMVIRLNLNE